MSIGAVQGANTTTTVVKAKFDVSDKDAIKQAITERISEVQKSLTKMEEHLESQARELATMPVFAGVMLACFDFDPLFAKVCFVAAIVLFCYSYYKKIEREQRIEDHEFYVYQLKKIGTRLSISNQVKQFSRFIFSAKSTTRIDFDTLYSKYSDYDKKILVRDNFLSVISKVKKQCTGPDTEPEQREVTKLYPATDEMDVSDLDSIIRVIDGLQQMCFDYKQLTYSQMSTLNNMIPFSTTALFASVCIISDYNLEASILGMVSFVALIAGIYKKKVCEGEILECA